MLNASTDQNVVMRRHKSVAEDEDRPVRRVSYLRATANENALTIDSDVDNSPMSAPPGTPDDLQITQILRRWVSLLFRMFGFSLTHTVEQMIWLQIRTGKPGPNNLIV